MVKRLASVFLILGLTACGVIPLPSQSLPDVTITVPLPLSPSSQVVYQQANAFSSAVSGSAQRLSISGRLTYRTNRVGTDADHLSFFIVSSLPGGCTNLLGQYLVCPDAAGGSQIGQATVKPGETVPVTLAGPALDAAAHAGKGYLGVRLDAGSAAPGDTLSFTNLLAGAYF